MFEAQMKAKQWDYQTDRLLPRQRDFRLTRPRGGLAEIARYARFQAVVFGGGKEKPRSRETAAAE
ncbi:hypothetical protein ABG957_07645, partial [Eggerthella lenta]|uniref:hypothetical protein n=1 Tax=Eggerthella lenta TaxID=84112 RepID=UPI00325B08F7